MNQVQVDQKIYQMPPLDGFTVAHFITVADIERSARFYETVLGGRILSRGDSKGAPRGTSRSRTRGSLSTSGAVRHPTNQR
jgi:predicted enzyme related to lactoylglutathione lyase